MVGFGVLGFGATVFVGFGVLGFGVFVLAGLGVLEAFGFGLFFFLGLLLGLLSRLELWFW